MKEINYLNLAKNIIQWLKEIQGMSIEDAEKELAKILEEQLK